MAFRRPQQGGQLLRLGLRALQLHQRLDAGQLVPLQQKRRQGRPLLHQRRVRAVLPGGQGHELAPGAHRVQQQPRPGGRQQEGGIGRALLQHLEQGVLGSGVHGVRRVDDIYLARALVGPDIGVGAQGADLVHRDLTLVRGGGGAPDIRVGARRYLPAGPAPPAGGALPPAQVGRRHPPGQGVPLLRAPPGDEVGVGQGAGQLHHSRSNRSTSTTNRVAPPTVTSTGMTGMKP